MPTVFYHPATEAAIEAAARLHFQDVFTRPIVDAYFEDGSWYVTVDDLAGPEDEEFHLYRVAGVLDSMQFDEIQKEKSTA